MNIRDLYALNAKALQVITDNDPSPYYTELVSHLSTMLTSPTPELQVTINETIATIEKRNSLIDTQLSTIPHISYLEENTEIKDVVGDGATEKLKAALSSDPYFASTSVGEMAKEITDLMAIFRETNLTLAQYGVEVEEEQLAMVSFELGGDIEVNTTTQLTYRLGELESIIHAFARLDNDPRAFDKPAIYSMSKSSPIIIDLGSTVSALHNGITLFMLAKAITWTMSRIEQAQKIRLNHRQLQQDDMSNEDIEAGFKKLEDDMLSEESIKQYVEEELITDEAVQITETSGSDEEIKKALTTAMKTLAKLLQKGVTANVYLPATIDPENPEMTEEELAAAAQLTVSIARTQKSIGMYETDIKKLESGEVQAVEEEPEA